MVPVHAFIEPLKSWRCVSVWELDFVCLCFACLSGRNDSNRAFFLSIIVSLSVDLYSGNPSLWSTQSHMHIPVRKYLNVHACRYTMRTGWNFLVGAEWARMCFWKLKTQTENFWKSGDCCCSHTVFYCSLSFWKYFEDEMFEN